MYRALVAIVLGLLLSLTVGCATKEIDADANQEFKADPEAVNKAMETTMQKMGANMRPEQKAAFEKMKSANQPDKSKAGGSTTP